LTFLHSGLSIVLTTSWFTEVVTSERLLEQKDLKLMLERYYEAVHFRS